MQVNEHSLILTHFFCFHSLILTQFLLIVHLLINKLLLIVKKRRNMRTVKCHLKLIQVQYRRRQKISFLRRAFKTEKENYTNHLIVFIRVNQHKRHLFSSNSIYLDVYVNQIVMKKRHKVARVCDRLLAQHEFLRLFFSSFFSI